MKKSITCIAISHLLIRPIVQKDNFHRREFSFTLKDDVYLRYQTFNDSSDFERELLRRVPFKIDIGSIYNQVVCCGYMLTLFMC